MTLNEISSTIRNKISDGLSGNITNTAYSLEQIEDEIDLARAGIIQDLKGTKDEVDIKLLLQTLDRLCLECRDIGNSGINGGECLSKVNTGNEVTSVRIPAPIGLNIAYVGTVDKMNAFKIYYDTEDLINHKYRFMTKKAPFVWADMSSRDSDGMITLYFFNMGKFNPLKYVSVRAPFESPFIALSLDPNYGNIEYPAPKHVQEKIIKKIVNDYVFTYRKLNIPPVPNTQSDPVT